LDSPKLLALCQTDKASERQADAYERLPSSKPYPGHFVLLEGYFWSVHSLMYNTIKLYTGKVLREAKLIEGLVSKVWDVAVVGGGITGVAVAREARAPGFLSSF